MRSLPLPLRFSLYVVGMLTMFFGALGLGAAAAVLTSGHSGQVPKVETVLAENTNFGGNANESPGTGGTSSEEAAIGPPSDSQESSPSEVVFTHRADDENSRGDYTYISHPGLEGDSQAVVLVSPTSDTPYGHNIGVWYTPVAHKWAIFNQDLAPVPPGSTFEVTIPPSTSRLVHRASSSNTSHDYTYIDSRLTNAKPEAVLSVTQNWNPGGGDGVYNDHPVGTVYDEDLDKWAVYNRDGAPIPAGAAFNIAVSTSTSDTTE